MTAITAPVLIMLAGFVVDYSYSSYLNQRLAKAADDAVLTAVSQSAATAVGGYGNTAGLQAYGTNLFNENIKQLPITGVSFNLTVTADGTGGVTASANYSYNSPALFGGLINRSTQMASGIVSSTAHPVTYVNYYILVDTSQSMGIGATQADMQALYNRVALYHDGGGDTGCVFGCHVLAPGQWVTNEVLAHNVSPRINLRIDAAITAIQDIVTAASNVAGTTRNIKFGIYTIQFDEYSTGNARYFKPVTSASDGTALSSDYTAVATAVSGITLGNNDVSGTGDTDFSNELNTFNTQALQANGTGASAASPLNFVFIVTDGLKDTTGACTDTHCTSAFNASLCDQLKTKATVGVIYTTYLPIYKNNDPSQGLDQRYIDLVQGNVGSIPTNLQRCATSSTYYFEATDGPGISSAMQALFARTQPTTARLTY